MTPWMIRTGSVRPASTGNCTPAWAALPSELRRPSFSGSPLLIGRSIFWRLQESINNSQKRVCKTIRIMTYLTRFAADPNCLPCVEPLRQDHRFESEVWQQWPFNMIYRTPFLLNQQWWHSAMTGVSGCRHTMKQQNVVRDETVCLHRLAGQFCRHESRGPLGYASRRRTLFSAAQ